jgi:ectoine utilization protein EutC
MSIRVLTEKELRLCVSVDDEAVRAVEAGFERLSRGEALVPPIMMLPVPEKRGEVDIKAALIRGEDSLAVKIASGFFDNPKAGLPSAGGLMVVLSTETGFPRALLLDNGYLTQVRTAAAGAIAAKYLAPRQVATAGVIGAGTQARFQMLGLKLVRDFKTLYVYSRRKDSVRRYVKEMNQLLQVQIKAADSVEEVIRHSEVVVTTTPAREPYLKADWLHAGLHITAMGADTEEKQELEPEVLARADIRACDHRAQCLRLGELHHLLAAGLIREDEPVTELGELVRGARPGRRRDNQISVCDLTGVGVQDTAIALLACRRARERGLGLELES